MKINFGLYYLLIVLLNLLVVTSLTVDSVDAQGHQPAPDDIDEVGIEEKLGEQISEDTRFFNEDGEEVQIGDYLNRDKPLILALVYYECPLLCNLILEGMYRGLEDLRWTPGDEFDILTVSIASDETPELAKSQKENYIDELGKPEAADGWHFLTGEEDQIRKLTDEVGFGFKWDESTQEYIHGSSLIFLSDEGVVTRYLHGIDYPELSMRNALYDAADGKIGSPMDRVVLYCYEYDPNSESYAPVAMNIMKIGGAATLVLLGLFLGIFWYREKKKEKLSVQNI